MSPGERIRALRENKDVSQKELSRQLGYKTYTTVSKWESGASLPPGKELRNLATYFEVSTDYILGLNNDLNHTSSDDFSGTITLDLFEAILPGTLQRGQNKGQIEVPQYILEEDPENYFVVNIKTDSMNRMIPSGNNIVVLDFSKTKKPVINTGDILIVKIDGEYKLEHLRKTDSKIYLEPYSYLEGFNVLEFDLKEFEALEIIGKVIYTFRTF